MFFRSLILFPLSHVLVKEILSIYIQLVFQLVGNVFCYKLKCGI